MVSYSRFIYPYSKNLVIAMLAAFGMLFVKKRATEISSWQFLSLLNAMIASG